MIFVVLYLQPLQCCYKLNSFFYINICGFCYHFRYYQSRNRWSSSSRSCTLYRYLFIVVGYNSKASYSQGCLLNLLGYSLSIVSQISLPWQPGSVAYRIWLTSFNCPTLKTPCYAQRSRIYPLHKPSYSVFCLKFRCHGNQRRSW